MDATENVEELLLRTFCGYGLMISCVLHDANICKIIR